MMDGASSDIGLERVTLSGVAIDEPSYATTTTTTATTTTTTTTANNTSAAFSQTTPSPPPSPSPRPSKWHQSLRRILRTILVFLGPGQLVAVGYIDPGNWATDIAGGAQAGYVHLFVILISNIIAIILQTLSLNLGSVSGRDLAQQCRASLHPVLNFCLWVTCEIAIMATDMAEVIGSAIALNLLFGLPIAAGVALTGMDVFIILLGLQNKLAYVEVLITGLVVFVFGSLVAVMVKSEPQASQVLMGYLPASSGLITDSATLYTAIAIIGATVMPHNLYLHSAIAREHFQTSFQKYRPSVSEESLSDAQRREREADSECFALEALDSGRGASVDLATDAALGGASSSLSQPSVDANKAFASGEARSRASTLSDEDSCRDSFTLKQPQQQRRQQQQSRRSPWSWVGKCMAYIRDESGDSAGEETGALIGGAPLSALVKVEKIQRFLFKCKVGLIASLMLACIINSSILIVAGRNFFYTGQTGEPGIEDAYYLLESMLGKGWAVIFAVSLLASGQSATITGTLAGAAVMEGFLNIRVRPWLRRIITRGLAIVPAIVVAIAVGESGVNQLLVISQVVLSVQLPFSIFPLVYFTSKEEIMASFVNSRGLKWLCYAIAAVLAAGNFYVLSQL